MGLLGIATDYNVGKYRGGKKDVAIDTFKSAGNDLTSMSALGPGFEVHPAPGENIVVAQVGNSNSFLVTVGGVNQEIVPDTEKGERRIYSVSADGKTIKAKVKWKNDGVLEINGASSFAVKFEELQTALNAFVLAVNANLALKLDGGGAAGTTSLNVTPAKSLDVKLS